MVSISCYVNGCCFRNPWANFIHKCASSTPPFFSYLPMSSSALFLPMMSLLSLLFTAFFFSHEKDLTQHRFCSSFQNARCSSRLSCSPRPHSASQGGRRAHESWGDPHPPYLTRRSLHALRLGRVYVVGADGSMRVLDLLPQINKELYVSFGDRE